MLNLFQHLLLKLRSLRMKVAIISDIHGNMQALESVLADIKAEKCDKIFCLGDLAMAGPEPVKAVKLIKKMAEDENFYLIQGNTDEFIANYSPELKEKIASNFPVMAAALENDVKIMPEKDIKFLKNLPKQLELKVEETKILLVHGSPRNNGENIFPDLPIEKVEEMLKGVDADLIFCGHTHIPCGYQTNTEQTVVNDGSVGRPFTSEPKACYVIAEFKDKKFNIMHKFIDYDKQKASEILAKRPFKGSEKLAQMLINPELRHI